MIIPYDDFPPCKCGHTAAEHDWEGACEICRCTHYWMSMNWPDGSSSKEIVTCMACGKVAETVYELRLSDDCGDDVGEHGPTLTQKVIPLALLGELVDEFERRQGKAALSKDHTAEHAWSAAAALLRKHLERASDG